MVAHSINTIELKNESKQRLELITNIVYYRSKKF